jgi:hypothetical protein
MRKFIFEHLITNGEEKLFDTEKSAIKYAMIKHSNESGDMVIVEVDITPKQLHDYLNDNIEIPCTAWRRDVWKS